LLYSDESEQGDTICYRTRNYVVTQLIAEAVNGGAFGHSGELAVLLRLLKACNGRSSPVYRDFCIKILVPHSELDHLEFSEGQQLYQAASSALPYPDKTLAHHTSLWTKNKGQDPLLAEKQLRAALVTPQYPYTSQQESQEHIYTSLAATALDSVDTGKRTLDEGKQIMVHPALPWVKI
jgi:hypothetical protein